MEMAPNNFENDNAQYDETDFVGQGFSSAVEEHSAGSIPKSRLLVEPGEKCDPQTLTARLEVAVKPLYSQELAYHGWPHVEAVRKNAEVLVHRAELLGIEVDKIALDHAILCHDLLYAVDPHPLGFESREALAGHYAYNTLRSLGSSEEHARKVEAIVYATHFSVEPSTIEEVLMRAADLRGLAGDYEDFLKSAMQLFEESKVLESSERSFGDFVDGQMRFLSMYTWRFLQLTPLAYNEHEGSEWHEKALQNMVQLFADSRGGRKQVEVVAGLDEQGYKDTLGRERVGNNEFHIHLQCDIENIEQDLSAAHRRQSALGGKGGVFFISHHGSVLPIADEQIDRFYVSAAEALRNGAELARVVRERGVLMVTDDSAQSKGSALDQSLAEFGFEREESDRELTVFRRSPLDQ